MAALHDACERLRAMESGDPNLSVAIPLMVDVIEAAGKLNLNCHDQQRRRGQGQPAGLRCRKCSRCVLAWSISCLLRGTRDFQGTPGQDENHEPGGVAGQLVEIDLEDKRIAQYEREHG